ncbi:MAG: hypothetical protein Q9169_003067 [Polycauliona sp. 2 TL-2023]
MDESNVPSSSRRHVGGSSLYSAPSSISSFSDRYPSSSPSLRPRSEASVQQSISDLKGLLDILFTNEIPGPKLIRLQREFCTPLGHGGQGNVYGVSPEFERKALDLQDQCDDERFKSSALFWTKCVVKHLRTDQRRNDIQYAFREISRLCNPSLSNHPNIVKLLSWGISLDALEAVNLGSLSTPLLILEKAHCDLAQLIRSELYATTSHETLCDLAMDIGHGLGAVHSAGIVHGDLKLENILIFLGDARVAGQKWTAKLCDFGSAVSISARSDACDSATYLGSETWLPPESYEKSLLGHPLPPSLAPCDIFVYGLVVWAMFIGIHFSPLYTIQKVDGHGADIVRHMGQQRFYARAKASVSGSFSPAYSDIHQLLAAFTEQVFGHFGGDAEREAVESRYQRRHKGRFSRDNGLPEEDKVRRILSVLRASLNDAPDQRDLQPWRYFDYKRYPSVPYVENPPRYTPTYAQNMAPSEDDTTIASRSRQVRALVLNTLFRPATYSLTNTSLSRWLEAAWTTLKQDCARIARGCISSTIQMVTQRRQKIYEDYLRLTFAGIPGFKDVYPLGTLEHPIGGGHYSFYASSDEMRLCNLTIAGTHQSLGTDQDFLYTWARLRSHLKPCCWQACSRDEEPVVQQYLNRFGTRVDKNVLAWLCRGEVGQLEVQRLSASRSQIWLFESSAHKSSLVDPIRTDAFLLLFERGFEIHSTRAASGPETTQFMRFLQSLEQPEHALRLAIHFQRIAREDTTSPGKRYFLTGRTANVDTEEDHKALFNTYTTTALHDAVRAANYSLVEYLVANAFNVSALDSAGRTALDSITNALHLPPTSDVNSIRALLEQSQPRQRRRKWAGEFPLGWEEFVHTSGRWRREPNLKIYNGSFPGLSWRQTFSESNSFVAWRETSIAGSFDAISFIEPKTGLYESDRLTLGRIRGEKQIYRLDPLRFLKPTDEKKVAHSRAAKPAFDEEWYRAEIQAVEKPQPFLPLHDARAWIRYPAGGMPFIWRQCGTQVFVLFTLLSLVTRLMRRPQLELIMAVLAVSLFSFGFSPSGVWVGTARYKRLMYPAYIPFTLSPESHYGSSLWSNAPELFLGISAVARGKTMLARSTLIGFILCNALWVSGISLIGVGLKQRFIVANRILPTMTRLCLMASAFITIVVVFGLSTCDHGDRRPSLDGISFVDHSIAIASLLLWAAFLAFRNYTHAAYVYGEYSDDGSPNESADLSPVENLIHALIRLIVLGFCTDNIVHSLLFQPGFTQSMCTYFAVPLATRAWAQYRGVQAKGAMDYTPEVIDSSIGPVLNTLLFVAPCLVLLGWIIGRPMNQQYSIPEIFLVDIAICTSSIIIRKWKGQFYGGALLMCLYVITALALYHYS